MWKFRFLQDVINFWSIIGSTFDLYPVESTLRIQNVKPKSRFHVKTKKKMLIFQCTCVHNRRTENVQGRL